MIGWASPIMLLFTCDYAIFYAPIMLNYARNYAPNYADYAKIMLNYAKLCPIMLNYANYALCSDSAIMPKSNAGIIGLAQATALRALLEKIAH